ncbi:MAG TPA: GDP-mannose 4,6-dehydratase [Acidimicrobiales bacterium]|nr:GDP-mannose 4,6-dehydratase [Acidimicrobiales bacterium]
MIRALVTGSDGFVGRHLTEHLVASGDDVSGFDRECDVTDRDAVARQVRAAAPDVIFHLAALTHVGASWTDPDETWRVNVAGTANVLSAARDERSALVVVVSSADVYGVVGEADLPLREDHPVSPVSPYARSKREAELVALDAARTLGQRVVVVRPFNHVGPGQSTSFVVPALASRLLAAKASGASEISVGDLSARRDFSDVRDVVRAYRLVAEHGRRGEVYNVASGRDVLLTEVAATLVDLINPGTRLVADPALSRPVEIPVLRGSARKLHDATGWEPRINWTTSLHDVVNDLVARGLGGAKAPE